jgi:hypothetical protein
LAALVGAGSGTLGLAKNPPESENNTWAITLRVYDYARVNRPAMLAAEGEATRILADAGVNALWVDCPTSHNDWDNYPNCHSPWQASDYILRILPNAMAGLQEKSRDALGDALNCDQGLSCTASVFYDRVRGLAGGASAPAAVLLGRVMAHEIGHLLLGTNAHSRRGIMQAFWSDRELSWEASHDLLFTVEQSRLLKRRLARQAGAWQGRW